MAEGGLDERTDSGMSEDMQGFDKNRSGRRRKTDNSSGTYMETLMMTIGREMDHRNCSVLEVVSQPGGIDT